MKALHQIVPSLQPGDAVSQHALEVRRLLREHGLESDIYVDGAHASLRRDVHHYRELRTRGRASEVGLLYQFAIGSPAADFLLDRPERRLVNYHNVTPASFFRPWDHHEAIATLVGRKQLDNLAAGTELAIAVSSFNEQELLEVGYRRTAVVPPLVDLDGFERGVDERALDALMTAKGRGGADWLFVGRRVPHKAQHDVVKAFALYREVYDPAARLHLVGGAGTRSYVAALDRYIADLGLSGVVDVAGSVSPGQLAAHYRAADVFVCLSEHEGFCIPLLEAMHHEVPIVAFAAAAVPETLGDAGVVLRHKDAATVAAAADLVVGDAGLRRRLVSAGARRLHDFDLERTRERFLAALQPVLASAVGS